MTASRKEHNLGPFVPGVDNRRPETKMQGDARTDKGDFLRSAVNADISNEGNVKRRAGYVQVLAATDAHSFWADGGDVYFADGQELKRVTGLPDNPVAETVLSTLAPGREVSFVRTPNAVYFSNGLTIGRLNGAQARTASTPELSVAPGVSAASGGLLPEATYGACFAYADAAGELSPSTTPRWVQAPAGSRLVFSGLPLSYPAGCSLVIFLTEPDGAMLMRAQVLLDPVASYEISAPRNLGMRCPTVQLRPMPPGDIVRQLGGRLLVAAGSVLYYSEVYQYGVMNPSKGFIQFPSDITVMETTSGGTWVCADQTYWFGGLDIAAADPNPVAAYGGVRGSGGQVPNSNDVFWMSPRGVMRGTQDGQFTNLQEAHVAVAPAAFAAGFFREFDGRKQFIESAFATDVNRMAAASYMDAEVVRKKVTL